MRDLEEILGSPLELPVRGKTYKVPTLSLKAGLRIQSEDPAITEASELVLWELVLGAVYQEMLDDDLPLSYIRRAGMAALADFQAGRAVADVVWEAGVDPEFQAALTAAAKAKTSKRSTSTASARKTPSRASTKATTSPPAHSAAANRSAGRRS